VAAPSAAIEQALSELSALSFVAHREVTDALPALRQHGDEVVLTWLRAVRRLFEHDREAGKAFVRGSYEAEKISETVLPWTEQALGLPPMAATRRRSRFLYAQSAPRVRHARARGRASVGGDRIHVVHASQR
jgi:hypothetical protein